MRALIGKSVVDKFGKKVGLVTEVTGKEEAGVPSKKPHLTIQIRSGFKKHKVKIPYTLVTKTEDKAVIIDSSKNEIRTFLKQALLEKERVKNKQDKEQRDDLRHSRDTTYVPIFSRV